MLSRPFIRWIAIALVAFWLPLSVMAQMSATHSLLQRMGTVNHPAFDASQAEALQAQGVVVVDAATFWQSVDGYGDGCESAALCALASLSLGSAGRVSTPIVHTVDVFVIATISRFHTRSEAPATPPPRASVIA
jgi:hypothetical protein